METPRLNSWINPVTFLIFFLAMRHTIAQPIDVQRLVEGAQGNAVAIVAMFGASPITGFGVVISPTSGGYVVATAKHVVQPTQGAQPTTVTVRSATGAAVTADRIDTGSAYDVAFIWVKGPPNPIWKDRIGSFDELVPGETAWIYGYENSWAFKGEGKVASVQQGIIQINDLHGWEGQSGAPVFTANGLIGLYLRAEGLGTSDVLSLSTLRSEAGRLGVPWAVFDSMWTPKAVRLTVERTDSNAVEIQVRHLQTGTLFSIGAHDAYSGQYATVYPTDLVQCSPPTFNVSRSISVQKIQLQCEPNLMGTWSNSQFRIQVRRIGDYEYSFEGITQITGSEVPASGRLQQNESGGRKYLVIARTVLGVTANGTAFVAPDLRSLQLHLSIEDQDFNQTLNRAP